MTTARAVLAQPAFLRDAHGTAPHGGAGVRLIIRCIPHTDNAPATHTDDTVNNGCLSIRTRDFMTRTRALNTPPLAEESALIASCRRSARNSSSVRASSGLIADVTPVDIALHPLLLFVVGFQTRQLRTRHPPAQTGNPQHQERDDAPSGDQLPKPD